MGEPSNWTAAHLAELRALPELPVYGIADRGFGIDGLDLWDQWPVQELDGSVARICGGALWMALSAPADGEPIERHVQARIRLLFDGSDGWHDLGNALPDGLSPGSREWSGSAVREGERVRLFFTAAGRRGEARTTYEQRLFQTNACLDGRRLVEWSTPAEIVASDGIIYHLARQQDGVPGTIKAFRDPAYFRDPATSQDYLLFAASVGDGAFNGAVGLARARTLDDWELLPPIIRAEGVSNELERPHMLARDGRYYVFWSTQRSVFAPGIEAPTGLYGMVAERLRGPYAPLNSSGLVAANPAAAPDQAFSWLVLDDLSVVAFVDRLRGATGRYFGGHAAPPWQLALDGDRAWPVSGRASP